MQVVEKNGSQPQGSNISNLDLGFGFKGQYNLDSGHDQNKTDSGEERCKH